MTKVKKVLFPALLGLAIYYAVFGGEYSLFELREARQAIAAQADSLEALRQANDSLRARAQALEEDSAALEKIARESFGMIRDGEVLYRFVEPEDSVGSGGSGEGQGEGESGG